MLFNTLMLLMKAGSIFPDSINLQTQSKSYREPKATRHQWDFQMSLPVLLFVYLQQYVGQGFLSDLDVERITKDQFKDKTMLF